MTKFKIVLLLLITYVLPVSTQTRITTGTKDYSLKIFKLNNITNLDIRAQHAHINLLNWDKDSISIETTIEILSNKPNLSKEMLEEIKIKTTSFENTLQVKTVLVNDFHSTIPYKISYNIFFPKKLSLRLNNSHGEINLSTVEGGIIADIDYCSVNIKNLNCTDDSIRNQIKLSYCKGQINHLGSGNININNCQIDFFDAGEINLSSAYNILSFKTIDNIICNSKIDRIDLKSVNDINIKASNSTIYLNNFNNSALFECENGILNISNSSIAFAQLTINNNNTQTQLHLNPKASYTINGEINKGELLHPHHSKIEFLQDKNKLSFTGSVGNYPESNSKVIIFNNKQNIVFK